MKGEGYFVAEPYMTTAEVRQMPTEIISPESIRQAEAVVANSYHELSKHGNCDQALLNRALDLLLAADIEQGVL